MQQFTTYFKHYCDDRLLLKLAVAGLALFTTLKSCQSLYVTRIASSRVAYCRSGMLWVELIGTFGNPELALNTYGANWILRMNALAVRIFDSFRFIHLDRYRWQPWDHTFDHTSVIASTPSLKLGGPWLLSLLQMFWLLALYQYRYVDSCPVFKSSHLPSVIRPFRALRVSIEMR